ncbi:hypothetical protein FACS1894200_13910 [Spirochaetia bacterium]|nr:hypothetical protein FACS1894200_13910 [Spirochaetia bacterium]
MANKRNFSDTKTKEYSVTVVPVDRITLLELPNKTTYIQGEDFNPVGLLVRVEYEGNAVPEKNIGPDRDHLVLSGYNKNGTGVQTITVDYYGKQTSFDVMVRPKRLKSFLTIMTLL